MMHLLDRQNALLSGSSTLLIEADEQRFPRSRDNGFDYERGANTILFFGAQPGGGTPVQVGYAYFTFLEG